MKKSRQNNTPLIALSPSVCTGFTSGSRWAVFFYEKTIMDTLDLSVFPEPVERYIREFSTALSCPQSFVTLGVLAAGTAISAGKTIAIKAGYTETSNLFICLVGQKGMAKSPAIKGPCMPLTKIQDEASRNYYGLMREWQKTFDTASTKAEKVAVMSVKPKEPPVMYCTKGTTEGLVSTLRHNEEQGAPAHILIIRDELNGFFGDMNAYRSGGAGSDNEWFLSAYNGASNVVRNVTNKQSIAGATISLVGSIQPSIFQNAFSDTHKDAGLFDRFLFAIDTSFPSPSDPFAEVSQQTQDAYSSWIVEAYDAVRYESTEDAPTLHLTRKQQEWVRDFLQEMHMIGKKHATGAFKKWEINFYRLLVVMAGIWQDGTITDSTFEKTMTLARFLISQWTTSFSMSEQGEHAKISEIIVEMLTNKKVMSERDIKRTKRLQRLPGTVAEVLGELKERGIISCLEVKKSGGVTRTYAMKVTT